MPSRSTKAFWTFIATRWGCEVSNLTLGVDPGAAGALAWVTPDGHLIDVADMPMVEVRGKKRVSAAGLADIMASRPVSAVIIEGVNAMPRQGVSSSFAFGYAAGIIEGIAAGLQLPVQIIPSAQWKRHAGLNADKEVSRQMALRLWPGAAKMFARKKDEGRAEAALLARWAGSRVTRGA
jgi:crossover junction endodeoxyribonuclease RuvC